MSEKYGIIGAMDPEVAALVEMLENRTSEVIAGMEFFSGSFGDTQAVVVKCGMGKVNAGICAHTLINRYGVSAVINTGVAGSLNAKLDIGDIVLSKDVIHHDVDATIFGYQPGEVPQLGIREFPADERLGQLAQKICQEVIPEVKSRLGRVVSGDQFISDKGVKERLINLYQGDCAEMEGAAIAHGSYLNGIPFVILRAISDKADDSASVDYPVFEKAAAMHCAKLVEALVAEI